MSARDELRDCFLSDSRDRFEAAADAYTAEVLREAAARLDKAALERPLRDAEAIRSATAELRSLADAAVSGSTAGDKQPETEVEQLRARVAELEQQLGRAVDARNYWHYEVKNADARIAELETKLRKGGAR